MLADEIYLELVRRGSEAMAATPVDALERPVPGCPDWNVGQVLAHTGWIHRWVTAILANGGGRVSARGIEQGPAGADVLPWFAASTEPLLDQLRTLDPDAEAHTFVGVRPARFWRRRMAQETTVHRWDVESARTEPAPIEPEVAVDGIEEVWDVYFPNRFSWGVVEPGSTVHLHATDAEGEWVVHVGADAAGSRVERGHAKADVAVRGTACDLLLYCFGRRRPEQLEVFGDASLAARFQGAGRY